jgi:phenylalanyl-tRNA synthetase alpha chain
MYRLTDEGKEYKNKSLPEKNLLKFIGNGKNLDEIKQLPKSSIAIGWARKNNWIIINEGGTVELTEEGRKALSSKTPVELTLSEIDSKGRSDREEELKTLISRGLIEEVKEVRQEKKLGILQRIINILFGKKKEESLAIDNSYAQLTPELIKTKKFREMTPKSYDVKSPSPKIYSGKKQPYMQFIEDIRERLIGLGFEEMRGPLIETFFWNCDALFMPQDHPARGVHDVLILKNPQFGRLPDKNVVSKIKATHEGGWVTESIGWGGTWSEKEAEKLLLRSQTTSVSARTLYKHGDKPGKYFTIDRIYRPDVLSSSHLTEFDQCEGIVVGENLTFRHLLGFLKEICEAIGIKQYRFKPAYFPFTSPSVELYVYHPKIGWFEGGGAGLMRPEVLRPLGIEKSQVLAWGLGLGRLAMLKLGIDDIRQLYSDDLQFLRETPLVR